MIILESVEEEGAEMFLLLRVDDRLLHGQVALSWTKKLKLETILIANEKAVDDEFTIMTLNLAKPKNVQIIIEDLQDAIACLQKGELINRRVMVVVSNLYDAFEILEKLPSIRTLNIGGLRERKNSVQINEFVALTESDLVILRKIKKHVDVYIQKIPDDCRIVIDEIEQIFEASYE